MPARRDEAVVLSRYPFRERDQIVVVLTRESGQVRLVARRSRGLHSRSAAALEPLATVRISYFESPRSELCRLDEVVQVRSAFSLTARPRAWGAAQVVAELALLYCQPGQRSERAFRLVGHCLAALEDGVEPLAVAQYAEVWFLRLAGVLPDVGRCGVCDAVLGRGESAFDAEESRFVCDAHRPKRVVLLDAGVVEWLVTAQLRPVTALVGPLAPGGAAWLASVQRHFSEREIASRAYLAALYRDPSTA